MVYGEHSEWGNLSNMTALDELWDGMDVNPGVIALPHDNSLATTQDFPWDKSKGLYMLNSYHNLHCLVRRTSAFRAFILFASRDERISLIKTERNRR
jgi:hypothetical protein